MIALTAICNPSQYNSRGIDVIESNFIQPRKIADICAKHKKWLIQFSTSEVYGQTLSHWMQNELSPSSNMNPKFYELSERVSPMLMGPVQDLRWSYACAKQLLERYILALHQEKGLEYTLIRPFNFLGTRMDFLPGIDGEGVPRVLACFTAALLENKPMQLVDGGEAKRTFLAIEEAIEALLLMIQKPDQAKNQIFNLGNRENEITIYELAQSMRKIMAKVTANSDYLDHPMNSVSAENFYGPGYADSDRRMPNIDLAKNLLGWNPDKNMEQILMPILTEAFEKYSKAYRPKEPNIAPVSL